MSQMKKWILQLPPGWIEDDNQTMTNETAVKCEPLSEDIDNTEDLPSDATDQTVSEQDLESRLDDLDNEIEEMDPLMLRDVNLVDSKDFAANDDLAISSGQLLQVRSSIVDGDKQQQHER